MTLPHFFGDFFFFFFLKTCSRSALSYRLLTPQFAALRWPCWSFGVLTLNKCQLYGSILTHSSSLLKLTNNSLSMGGQEKLDSGSCGSGDALATGFTLIDQSVSTCTVLTGGGMSGTNRRHHLFFSGKRPCSVSVGGSVQTLLSDDLAVGGVES